MTDPAVLRTRPTAALVRAAAVAGIGLAAAVVAGRPAVVLAVLPLLAWVLVAAARRRAGGAAVDVPRATASRRVLEEGATATVSVRSRPGIFTVASLPLRPRTDLSPRRGSAAGDGAVHVRVTARRWGSVRTGPVHVVLGDPLGAFRAQTTVPGPDLQVVPGSTVLDAPVEVPTPVGISGVHLSRRRGAGTALAEVRPFRPGDRLHRMNWRVTSRTGQLHTNATFTEQDTDVLVVTDTLADVEPAPWADAEAPTSLDMTIRATAAVARHYLRAGDRVAVADLGHLLGPVRPGTGPRQLRVLTDALSRARRPDGPAQPPRRLRAVRPGTLVVVCTPLLAPAAIGQIGLLVAQGADVVVVDTLPPSIGDTGVLTGRPVAAAGRSGERYWAEAWALRRLERRRTVRELREAGVPVTAWEGPSSLAPVLLSLSHARSAPRRRS